MRLNLTLGELERGYAIAGGSGERLLNLKMLAHRREPIAITPIVNHDQKIVSIIIPVEEAVSVAGGIGLTFRPVWCKTFTLYSSREKLLALVCEFEHGKFWIDNDGAKKCTLTLQGNGTDPDIVVKSYSVLADFLAAKERPNIILHAIQFIQKNF